MYIVHEGLGLQRLYNWQFVYQHRPYYTGLECWSCWSWTHFGTVIVGLLDIQETHQYSADIIGLSSTTVA